MAGIHNFRSAMRGFHREDVVQYIEYINNKHNAEREQLNTQLQIAREELAKKQDNTELLAQLEAANTRCAELEAKVAQLEADMEELTTAQPEEAPEAPAAPEVPAKTAEDELEGYRRAERAERLARERAAQIYTKANAILADATVTVETVSDNLSALTAQLTAQAETAKVQLQEAVASMYAIRPEEE